MAGYIHTADDQPHLAPVPEAVASVAAKPFREPTTMCRYAYKTYKPHFVCFRCRKQFKRPAMTDVLSRLGKLRSYERLSKVFAKPVQRAVLEASLGTTIDQLRAEVRELVSRCPQCRAPMADLGLDFKPPRSTAVRAWTRIERMHRLGHAWHTCGCDGPGFVPTDATGYAEYLAARERLFARYLDRVESDPNLRPEVRAVEAAHWTHLLAEVHAAKNKPHER